MSLTKFRTWVMKLIHRHCCEQFPVIVVILCSAEEIMRLLKACKHLERKPLKETAYNQSFDHQSSWTPGSWFCLDMLLYISLNVLYWHFEHNKKGANISIRFEKSPEILPPISHNQAPSRQRNRTTGKMKKIVGFWVNCPFKLYKNTLI